MWIGVRAELVVQQYGKSHYHLDMLELWIGSKGQGWCQGCAGSELVLPSGCWMGARVKEFGSGGQVTLAKAWGQSSGQVV